MYLDKQSRQNLLSVTQYRPSHEYLLMREKLINRPTGVIKKSVFIKILKSTHQKLSRIAYAMKVAENTNRRVSHVENGVIKLVA